MKAVALLFLAALPLVMGSGPTTSAQPLNPRIDMDGYLKMAKAAARHRETRRLSEEDFIRLSRIPGVVVLDARSRSKFDEMHVKGAVNLSFPDIAMESLNRMFPDKSATILIYCNNNFRGAERAFASKRPDASLNLSTYIALYSYGYRNIYELGPNIEVGKTMLTMEGSDVAGL